jgi:hypothetical protein
MKTIGARVLVGAAVLFVLCVASIGCGEQGPAGDDGGAGADADADADGDSDTNDSDGVCAEEPLDLQLAGVKVMLVVDSSASMMDSWFGGEDKWTETIAAVDAFVNDPANADTWFGLHTFPNLWLGFVPTCDTQPAPAIDLAQGNGAEIVQWMTDNPPGLISITPMLSSLEYYLGAAPTELHDATTSNYIVLLSDGADDCYVPTLLQDYRKYNLLAGITDDLKDVVNIDTIAIGLGEDVSADELNAIAAHGGSSFTSYIPAADGPALQAAFQEIAQSIHPCKYILPSPDADFDATKVNFYFDGAIVERDRTHADGWDWTESDELEVEFFGPSCQAIKDGSVTDVAAKFGCPTQIDGETCADYEAFLPFPEEAVMLLLDYSGSMMGEKWQAATTAITDMLVDDRNNRVQFGFDAFPSDNGCEVSEWPMFTVGDQLNHMPIIEWGAESDPITGGYTPLHDALQRFILRPGALADADKTGVLIVVTDGEDSCYEPAEEIVGALSETVTALVEENNIHVFAIGYGSDADPDQLNAIAQAGGTGLDTYMQADSPEDLETLFGQIANMVTSCIFAVPNPGDNVDYSQVNIYVDGDVVPRDVAHADGWDWYNPVNKTKVEFYGSYCEMLKSGEISDVTIEFGCDTVTVE